MGFESFFLIFLINFKEIPKVVIGFYVCIEIFNEKNYKSVVFEIFLYFHMVWFYFWYILNGVHFELQKKI